MAKRIPINRLFSKAIGLSADRISREFGAPFRSLRLSVGKPNVFFDGRPKLNLGNRSEGKRLLRGQFTHIGQTLDVGVGGDPWRVASPSERFADWLHRFHWMEDLATLTEKSAPIRMRYLVDSWINEFGDFNSFAWELDILTYRLFNWLRYWSPSLSTDSLGEVAQRRRIVTLKQLKYLRNNYGRTQTGLARFMAAITIALGGARLADKAEGYLDRALDWLDDEIHLQILPDGGHVSRSPEKAQKVLEALLTLDNILEARGIARSKAMGRAIDRLRPIMPFFSSGGGGLVSFNGGGEGDAKRFAKLLKHLNVTSRPFGYCPHTGYQRIEQEGTILIVDTGDVPDAPYDRDAHLGPLAFELSTGDGRLIVNCGWSDEQPFKWRAPMRATAAHSTLTLDQVSSGRLVEGGLTERLLGPVVARGAGAVKAQRKEQVDGLWLEAKHEGYREEYGLVHKRRFYMAMDGQDVRGEDSLLVPLGGTPLRRDTIPFAIRFHLHPTVKATLAQDQKSALLIQANSKGWRLRTDGGALVIEPSFYLGYGHKPVKSQQIVIRGQAFGDGDGETRSNRVRWSIRRLEARK